MCDPNHEQRLIDEYCGDSNLCLQALREYQSMRTELASRGWDIGARTVEEIVREISEL